MGGGGVNRVEKEEDGRSLVALCRFVSPSDPPRKCSATSTRMRTQIMSIYIEWYKASTEKLGSQVYRLVTTQL